MSERAVDQRWTSRMGSWSSDRGHASGHWPGCLLRQFPRLEVAVLLFPGTKGQPLSDMTMTSVMRRMRVDAVPHGFRSTFRDWMGEKTNYPRELAKQELAHVLENKMEAAYRGGDVLEKRRDMVEDWSCFNNKDVGESRSKDLLGGDTFTMLSAEVGISERRVSTHQRHSLPQNRCREAVSRANTKGHFECLRAIDSVYAADQVLFKFEVSRITRTILNIPLLDATYLHKANLHHLRKIQNNPTSASTGFYIVELVNYIGFKTPNKLTQEKFLSPSPEILHVTESIIFTSH